MMLGTNGAQAAMQSRAIKGLVERERTLAAYRKNLEFLRQLPSRPVVIVASLPPMGITGPYPTVPAMNELVAHLASTDGYPYIDMTRALAGLVSELPSGSSWTPNRLAVQPWSHIGDHLHPNYGPSLAKFYGLVARNILEPREWYQLNLRSSAVDDPAWTEAWLLARAVREPVESPSCAQGIVATAVNGQWTFAPTTKPGGQVPIDNGVVSFLKPKTGGNFYLMRDRHYCLNFGRPYQLVSDQLPPETAGSFPDKYSITGVITRGDGEPASHVAIMLDEQEIKSDVGGRFAFVGVTGNILLK